MELLQELDVVPAPNAVRGRGPLADTVHGEHGGLLERRGEEGACRMGLVMLGVQELAREPQRLAKLSVHVQLVLEPDRCGQEERSEAARRDAKIGLEDPLELEQGLVIEADVGKIGRSDAGGPQAVFGGTRRERRVPLLTAETLLLCSRDNLPVPQQAGGAVVVECGDTQDVGVRHVIELGRAVVSGSTQRMQDLGCEQASQRVALTASAPASCATIIRATAARLLPTAVWPRCNRNGDRPLRDCGLPHLTYHAASPGGGCRRAESRSRTVPTPLAGTTSGGARSPRVPPYPFHPHHPSP